MNEREDIPLIDLQHKSSSPKSVGRVEEVLRYIESRYLNDVDKKPLEDEAIMAIIKQLDPHSVYIPAYHMVEVTEDMEGQYRGIGIETAIIQDTLHVVNTLPESPAAKARLKRYDRIVSINETPVAGVDMPFDTIKGYLQSTSDQVLQLRIYRDDIDTTIALSNDLVNLTSVKLHTALQDSVGYIYINRFSEKTYKEFMTALEPMVEEGKVKHLIIDLRDNPGGLLPEATNILSQLFREKDRMLVYTKGKDGRNSEYKSVGKPFFYIDKVAVLINENSASGSEIIAGAIQDWDRGVIIGRRSFGKGLVQDQYRLQDGSALRLTKAKYYTPTGRSIQKPFDDVYAYENELNGRYTNGEYFTDTLHTLVDTTVFNSLVLGRPLYAKGGITPDIFVASDSATYTASYMALSKATTTTAYEYLYSSRPTLPATADAFMTSYQVPDDLLERLLHNTDEEGINATHLNKHAKALKQMVKYHVGRLQYGQDAVIGYDLLEDDFVAAALQFFSSNKSLSDL